MLIIITYFTYYYNVYSYITFTAGADIKEMQPLTYDYTYAQSYLDNFADLQRLKKPLIAAVNGYAVC